MSTVSCLFCDKTFYGLSPQDAWNKAWKHETENHRRELQELEAQSRD